MYFAYILKSLKDGSHYYGSTNNLESRLKHHNSGKVRYTKGHIPYVIHYFEKLSTRAEAMKREKFFKSIAGYNWLKSNNII
jgi:putative endonuclease